MGEAMDVSIIIVNYNKYEDTLACVDSIKKSEASVSYNIILVDKGRCKICIILHEQNQILVFLGVV